MGREGRERGRRGKGRGGGSLRHCRWGIDAPAATATTTTTTTNYCVGNCTALLTSSSTAAKDSIRLVGMSEMNPMVST